MGIFVAAIIRFVPKLRELLTSIQTMKIHSGSLNVVLKRFRQASEMSEIRVGERLFQQLKSGIEFKDVNFNYDSSSAPALQGINLFIPVNQVTAIVGPSGAGKSTLVDLIPRFLEPSAGKVLFDDIPVNNFQLDSLRSQIAYCPQEPKILNLPVADFIGYGSSLSQKNP